MEKKRNKSMFFVKLFMVLTVIVALVFGVYFMLDKLIVPKYFKTYGIQNMHDLVAMVKTLYNSPDEKDILTNAYLPSDEVSAVSKLKDAGFPMTSDGQIDYMRISGGIDREKLNPGDYEFSDREIASILDQMLESESGVLASKLPDIKYIDAINIDVLELIIEPTKSFNGDEVEVFDNDSAKVSITCRVDTSSVRTQMAKAMDTPLFLLNMIVPQTLYITVNYDIQRDLQGEWHSDKGAMAINGRTAQDSQILLDLLIEFIFPEEDKMTVDKLCSTFGDILIQGVGIFGDVRVKAAKDASDTNGIILTI